MCYGPDEIEAAMRRQFERDRKRIAEETMPKPKPCKARQLFEASESVIQLARQVVEAQDGSAIALVQKVGLLSRAVRRFDRLNRGE